MRELRAEYYAIANLRIVIKTTDIESRTNLSIWTTHANVITRPRVHEATNYIQVD